MALILSAAFTAEAQSQSIQVTNNSGCNVYVSLRAQTADNPCFLNPWPTRSVMVPAGGGFYNFTQGDLVTCSDINGNIYQPAPGWFFISAVVNNPPCGMQDGVQVFDPNFGSPSSADYVGCGCGAINVDFTPNGTIDIY